MLIYESKTSPDELRSTILESNKAPRGLVVQYVKMLCEHAQQLPKSELIAKGDYKDKAKKFPQTKGEDIASDISSLLAQQDWIGWDSEPVLEEVCSIAGSLEINTDDGELWKSLFKKVDAL